MTRNPNSPMLHALHRAAALAAKEPHTHATYQTLPPFSGSRGQMRGGVLPPLPDQTQSPADVLVSQLADANATLQAQITALRSWLASHPDLLRLLDAGMSEEFQAMEQRTNRKNIAYNAIFTALGAVLGLVLPAAVSSVPQLLALIGH